MARAARNHNHPSLLSYAGTLGLVLLALAFPISLMVFNPTLMFERGWEQYAGASFYFLAVLLLGRELLRFWNEERSFKEANRMLDDPGIIDESDERLLPARLRGLSRGRLTVAQAVEINREASALDQEHAAARFTLPRYILYLLPVIGFIGTVEGISKALMNISIVLPMVNDLDSFLNNLTSVTAALQIAFDSTLLALFLSAALMLVQTVIQRRAESVLAKVDRWVVEHVLPEQGRREARAANPGESLGPVLERLEEVLANLTERLETPVSRFASAVDRLPPALADLERGTSALAAAFEEADTPARALEALQKSATTLARIEAALLAGSEPDEQLDLIRRGIDRNGAAIEALASQLSTAFERNSRSTQDQLARTLGSLKEALDLLHVSMEQGNSLYRSIVKKMVPSYLPTSEDRAA